MQKHTPGQQNKEIQRFLEKIVVNVGVGRLSQAGNFEDKVLPQLSRDVAAVCGQKPQVCRAKKSIAGFKIREGQIVGLRVTLRGRRMVDFFERLITIVMPRVRDFHGLNLTAVDEGGSLNIGLKEQFVFSEVSPEESPAVFSLQVTVVPLKRDREAAIAAYRRFGVPLKK
jgi:large subunit ribosomal protein L5